MFLFTVPEFALFCLGALALVAFPGAAFFFVFSRGLSQGRGAGAVAACGISTGLIVHTVLAASGLSLLLARARRL